MGARVDIKGQRFGRLLVLCEDLREREAGRALWKCQCDCGTVKSINSNNLRSGKTNSCGCLFKEQMVTNFSKGRRIWIDYNGERLCQAAFLRKYGHGSVKIDIFRRRIASGMEPILAATEPFQRRTFKRVPEGDRQCPTNGAGDDLDKVA